MIKELIAVCLRQPQRARLYCRNLMDGNFDDGVAQEIFNETFMKVLVKAKA